MPDQNEDVPQPRAPITAYDRVFVRHPERYWTFNNSNQMVARWLEQLGCRVDGPTLFSAWRRGSAEEAGATTRSTRPAAATPR